VDKKSVNPHTHMRVQQSIYNSVFYPDNVFGGTGPDRGASGENSRTKVQNVVVDSTAECFGGQHRETPKRHQIIKNNIFRMNSHSNRLS